MVKKEVSEVEKRNNREKSMKQKAGSLRGKTKPMTLMNLKPG